MSKPIQPRRYRSLEEITAILVAFDRSGQSAVAFAQANQLVLSTLRLWLSRRRKRPRDGSVLIPVTITGGDLALPAMIEVALTNGRVLRFPRGLRPEELAAIADALEQPCSH